MRYQSILAAGLVLGLGLITNTASAQDQHHRVTGAQVSLSSVESVRVGEHVRIEQFETPLGKLDLELDRVEVLTRDAQVVLGTAQGMLDMPELDVVVLRGIIAGDADSIAYIAMSPYGTNGFIRKDGEMVSISTGPYAQGKELAEALRTAKMDDVVNPLAGNAPPSACGYEDGNAQLAPFGLPMADIEPKDEQSTRGIDGTSCRVASIAIETDWEYNQRLFDGNSTAWSARSPRFTSVISTHAWPFRTCAFGKTTRTRMSIPSQQTATSISRRTTCCIRSAITGTRACSMWTGP